MGTEENKDNKKAGKWLSSSLIQYTIIEKIKLKVLKTKNVNGTNDSSVL